MKPVGVIFDMDGVLVDSADAHWESWKRLAVELGQPVTQEQFAATFGRQNRDIIPLVFNETSEESIGRLANRKEELYRALVKGRMPIVVGAVQLVRSLADRGVRLAVGSSAPRENIELVLAEMGVGALIGSIVSGDDVSRGKPDPQVFELACERLRLVPARCVVVEDAPSGVEAAVRAGAAAVGVAIYHPRAALAGAVLIVSKLADLTAQTLIELASDGADNRC